MHSAVLRGEAFQRMHPPLPALAAEDVDADPARPLVVGYMSPDLFTHSVSYFAEAPLALHNPGRRAGRWFPVHLQQHLLGNLAANLILHYHASLILLA